MSSAQDLYNTAVQVISNARFKSFGSTDDLINHLAWGQRSWLMGEMELASTVDEVLSLLQKIEQRLDRLERSGRPFSR